MHRIMHLMNEDEEFYKMSSSDILHFLFSTENGTHGFRKHENKSSVLTLIKTGILISQLCLYHICAKVQVYFSFSSLKSPQQLSVTDYAILM